MKDVSETDARPTGDLEHPFSSPSPLGDAVSEPKCTEETLRRQVEELATLQAIVLDIAAPHDLPTLLQTIVERATRLLDAPGGGLYLCDPERQEVRCVVSYNTPHDYTGVVLKYGEGAAGVVAQTGQPLIIDDYRIWPGRAPTYEQDQPFTAVLSAPMLWQGQVIGVIRVLHNVETRRFTPKDLQLLTLLANHAAIAVANTRLYEKTRRRVQELESLYQASTSVVGNLKLEETLQRIIDAAVHAVPAAQKGSLHLLDEQRNVLVMRAGHGFSREVMEAATFRVGEGYTGWVFAHNQPLILANVKTDPRTKVIELPEVEEEKSAICVPLVVKGKTIGTITLDSVASYNAFNEDDLRVLSAFATQAAIAFENARLYEVAQRELAERKRAEERLRQSQQLLERTLHSLEDAVFIMDAKTTQILDCNHAASRIFGYNREEMLGRTTAFLHVNRAALEQFRRHLFSAVEKRGFLHLFEFQMKRKDGTIFPTEHSVTPLEDEQGNRTGWVSVVRDITEHKRLEEQLRYSQRMETVGRLAGGVAHEFNNLLMAITGYASLAIDTLRLDDPVREDLEQIVKIAEQGANLTRQLLALGRRQIIAPRVINLNDLILNMDKMLRRLLGDDIELVTVPAPDLGLVKVDPGQIEQALINLVVNARDAMPRGGKLTIETANVTLDEDYVRQHVGTVPGDFVLLAVSDTGVGMTEEVKEHLFEPFFTTKEIGQGTGLGLSTVYGIVKQHEGYIWVYSEPGQGTTFKIYLPRVREKPERLPRQDEEGYLPRGTETVLVVEDDPAVREVMVRILREQGYTVLEAASADEALQIAARAEGIQLLLTDVVMPKMSGKALAERLRVIYPNLKVLYVSGYSDNAIAHHGIFEKGIAFLQKPFTIAALARKVREVLG